VTPRDIDRSERLRAIEQARAHFDNFNLDLMYGLPGQTVEEALSDIEQALAFDPPHLSCYHLTIEPNTWFHRFPPKLPDDDTTAAMQDAIEARFAAAGYDHYETSAYAKTITASSARCAHNLNYWTFGDYLGVGAGAHSKISFPHRVVRQVRFRRPASYLENAARGEFVAESHEVARDQLPFEFMLNALRLADGVPSNSFLERTGVPLSIVESELNSAEQRGLLVRDHRTMRPTLLGLRFLTALQTLFLKAAAPS
jgi:oxygen-independent coproporphyrinogen-3 oxidase